MCRICDPEGVETYRLRTIALSSESHRLWAVHPEQDLSGLESRPSASEPGRLRLLCWQRRQLPLPQSRAPRPDLCTSCIFSCFSLLFRSPLVRLSFSSSVTFFSRKLTCSVWGNRLVKALEATEPRLQKSSWRGSPSNSARRTVIFGEEGAYTTALSHPELRGGTGSKAPGSSREPHPHTCQGHAQRPRAHLLCDVIVTGVDAVSEQVLSAAIAAAEVTAVHELPVGEGTRLPSLPPSGAPTQAMG